MARLSTGLSSISSRKLRRPAAEPIPAGSVVSLQNDGTFAQAQRGGIYRRRRVIGIAISEAEVAGQLVTVAMSGSVLQLDDSIAAGSILCLDDTKGGYSLTQTGGEDDVPIGVVGASNVLYVELADAFFSAMADDGEPLDALGPPVGSIIAWWDGTDSSTMNTQSGGGGSVPTVGQSFARWVDKVSSIAAITGIAPTYQGTYVDCASDKLIAQSARTLLKPLHDGTGGSIYWRGRFDGDGTADILFDATNFATEGPGLILFRRATNVVSAIVWNASAEVLEVDAEAVVAADGTVDIVASIDADGGHVWIDGTEYTAARSATYATGDAGTDYSMFNRSTGSGFALNGRCQQIVVSDEEATDQRVSDFAGWS